MRTRRRGRSIPWVVAAICFTVQFLRADDVWDKQKRKEGGKAAEEAVHQWTASQPFAFKIAEDVYSRSTQPKFGGQLYVFHPERYGRRNVLQIHPFDEKLPDGIGSIAGKEMLGAVECATGDYSLSMQRTEAGVSGSIARKLDLKMAPGFTWYGEKEPTLVVFAGKGSSAESLFNAAQKIRSMALSPYPVGEMRYHEEKE